MEETPAVTDAPARPPAAPEREFGLPGETVRAVVEALDAGEPARVDELVRSLHYADLADLLEALDDEHRARLIDQLGDRLDPECLHELDEPVRNQVVEQLGTFRVAKAIARLDSDDALYVIEDLEEERRRQVLQAMPAALRDLLEQGLSFPEESAGRLMQREVAAVPSFWTVGQTIDFMRESDDLPDDFYDLFVVDAKHRPIGTIPLNRLLRTKRPVKVSEIMRTPVHAVPVSTDQEAVAFLFRHHDLTSAPVVDDARRLIGVITVDDVVDVIEEEAEEDIMRLGGVMDEGFHARPFETVRRRQSWLVITLFNTIIASIVISRFEAAIEQLVALAVLMPIVAAMGGNAGMQVVTVVVRGLATRELTSANTARVVGRELLVGSMNGLVFGTIMATIAGLWFQDLGLALVLASAMIFNMVWAGFAGTMIPLALSRFGIDPAVAAGPFLTTTTDVLGFFIFLGLATVFLL
ncbi:MAG TPA: magnesium transporter [Geminicoccaceae bacterium]|nr:magnesium transporter [Geminicoccaceae bacterium]